MKLAQIPFDKIDIGSKGGVIDVNDTSLTLGEIVGNLLPYIFVFAGLGLLFYIIYGGYHYIVALGDPKGLQEARGKLLNALIGFFIIFAAYWIVQIAGYILGLPDLLIIF
jgi:hypothetical protein